MHGHVGVFTATTVALLDVQRALALHIAKFPEALEETLGDLMPNRITEYLYTLSEAFNSFYTECTVSA